jgi:hypothetical protein
MINLGPNWYPPPTGVADFRLALPAEIAAALGFFWLAILILSLAGIVWAATEDSRQRPLGKSKKGAPGRQPRGRAGRPALYPV